MSWADTVKATALAALAERSATDDRGFGGARWNWNSPDVWLTRARQPRDVAAQSPNSGPSTPLRQDTALPD
jgi:hypothetical protein